MSRVSDNIKKARMDIGISEKQLAKKLGVSDDFVKEVEAGRKVLNEATINRIEKVLNISLNDINMQGGDEIEETPRINSVTNKKETKKEEPINETWDGAFGSLLRQVNIYDQSLNKVISTRIMPIVSNKINGLPKDKVAFVVIEDDQMIGFRIGKGDTAFINLSSEAEDGHIYILEYNSERIIRHVKKLDNSKVLLIKNSGKVVTETVNLKDIKILARIISVEVQV